MIRNALQSIKRATVKTVVGGTLTIGLIEYTTQLPSQGRSSEVYHKISDKIVTPFMRKTLDPEGSCPLLRRFLLLSFSVCSNERTTHLTLYDCIIVLVRSTLFCV